MMESGCYGPGVPGFNMGTVTIPPLIIRDLDYPLLSWFMMPYKEQLNLWKKQFNYCQRRWWSMPLATSRCAGGLSAHSLK